MLSKRHDPRHLINLRTLVSKIYSYFLIDLLDNFFWGWWLLSVILVILTHKWFHFLRNGALENQNHMSNKVWNISHYLIMSWHVNVLKVVTSLWCQCFLAESNHSFILFIQHKSWLHAFIYHTYILCCLCLSKANSILKV